MASEGENKTIRHNSITNPSLRDTTSRQPAHRAQREPIIPFTGTAANIQDPKHII